MANKEELREAIRTVAESGFEVTNEKGGYIVYREKWGEFLHQTYCRSSNCFKDFDSAFDSFYNEINDDGGDTDEADET